MAASFQAASEGREGEREMIGKRTRKREREIAEWY
jgi:hypothetical protein